uniref:Uncharacterized protein n=1 Tax=Caenorhabditis japonica TaxID=281687 RepID=A0A8R1IDF6_CAEJA
MGLSESMNSAHEIVKIGFSCRRPEEHHGSTHQPLKSPPCVYPENCRKT